MTLTRMPTNTTSSVNLNLNAEREMTRHQRGLVDTCFEEGQFEAAIAELDQLRSSRYRPVSSHIRQLLYIALYPPNNESVKDHEPLEPLSPSKASKQHKSPLIPSPSASAAAQKLLFSFLATNSPEAIYRALPSYGISTDGSLTNGPELNGDGEDSYIGKEAICIKDSKNCWEIVKTGFINRRKQTYSTPKEKGKKRAHACLHEDSGSESDSIVADHAWPVLDWLIGIFEKDEVNEMTNGSPQYSPFLLSQIPPHRNGTGARWDINTPLNIVIHCMRRPNGERQRSMGTRLISLLINLTSTVLVDMSMFINSVYARLSLMNSDEVSILLSSVPLTEAVIRFKISLWQKFINHSAGTGGVSENPARRKPQARAQARTTRANLTGQTEQISSISNEQIAETTSISSNHSVPPVSEILNLLGKDLTGNKSATFPSSKMKFELLMAYGNFQNHVLGEGQDLAWSTAIHDGTVDKVIKIAFADEDGAVYGDILRAFILSR